MSEQPEEVSDVEVVLKGDYSGRNDEALRQLRGVGLEVVNVIDADGVVEGTLPADRLDRLQKLDCVAYVRNVFTYIAEGRAREEGSATPPGGAPAS
jgi:hypothetical protein